MTTRERIERLRREIDNAADDAEISEFRNDIEAALALIEKWEKALRFCEEIPHEGHGPRASRRAYEALALLNAESKPLTEGGGVSDTPRTDALFAQCLDATRNLDGPLTKASNISKMVEHARTLERENAMLRRALQEQGYVSVPREPTRAMLSALCGDPLLLAASQEQAARVAYDAMIAASQREGVQE